MSTRDGECSATVGYPAGPSSTVDPGPAADQGCKWCEGGDGSEHIEHVPADVWARKRKAFGLGPPNDRRKFVVRPSVRPFGRLGRLGLWVLRLETAGISCCLAGVLAKHRVCCAVGALYIPLPRRGVERGLFLAQLRVPQSVLQKTSAARDGFH